MFQKIFEKLKTSRPTNSNVSDRTLETLAKSLVTIITTDELLNAYDAKSAIDSMDGNIRNSSSEAIKKAEEIRKKEAEEAKKVEEQKKVEEAAKKAAQAQNNGDGVPEYVKAIMKQNELLSKNLESVQNQINGMSKTTIRQTREAKLAKTLKDLPDYIVNPIKNSFKVASFENDESFTEYLTGIEEDTSTFKDAARAQGLNTFSPSKEVKKPEPNGETPSLKSARELINKQKEKQNATNSNK